MARPAHSPLATAVRDSAPQTGAVAGSRGRDKFRRLRGPIRLMTAALACLPRRGRIAIWDLVESWNGVVGVGLRYCLLRSLAAECGDNVLVGPGVEIRGWEGLRVGSNVSIHRGCYIDALGGVSIGDDVSIAHATSILSFEHTWEDLSRPIKDNPLSAALVVIEPDVWIGCGCRVLAGVRLGTRTVVAAGAVVTKDVPEGSVAGGVPARVLKRILGPARAV
jgi:acetyltransferase-like isoleucine patch superfamily enzyme